MYKRQQYHIVGSHLLATLKEMGGNAVTEEVLTAWGKAYGVLADIFIGRESELYREKASQDGGWQGTRPFIIKEKRQESELITSFVLAPLDGNPVLRFKPGQYLSIKPVSYTHLDVYKRQHKHLMNKACKYADPSLK